MVPPHLHEGVAGKANVVEGSTSHPQALWAPNAQQTLRKTLSSARSPA